ncbi:MAG TPA: alpha/beta hydrolase [Candidatus Dormibacteraeota bacterium]|jgi:acetyl esterase/lipase|nr:alpha/beta hydrolase [Candidatus Dormibacteraeota bacterium]
MIEDPFAPIHEQPDPTLIAVVEQLEATMSAMPPMESMTAAQLRAREEQQAALNPSAAKRDDAEERAIAGPGGEVRLRILAPASEPAAVYVHIHGGGWIGGRHDLRDQFLHDLGTRLHAVVVSVAYRLAPEHPFPAPQDDCEAATAWVVEHAQQEFGTSTVVIGGESAGAHLAAATLLRMRDRHGYTGFAAADLRYGCYDLRLTPSVRHWKRPFLDRATMEWLVPQVIGGLPVEDPDVSPFLADLHDLPPALFTVGTGDSLLDDSVLMWARWRTAGNTADLAICPGAPHGFDLMPLPPGETARARAAAFVTDCIAQRAVEVA